MFSWLMRTLWGDKRWRFFAGKETRFFQKTGFLGTFRTATKPWRTDLRFVMYTRQGCHLCDSAWELLLACQRTYHFALTLKDVDENPDWVEQFGKCVPVVEVNDKVRFRGRVNEVLLKRLLEANASGQSKAT